jgi:hypothetical protein
MINYDKDPKATLVSEEDFQRYEAVRASGRYNMRTNEARLFTGIEKATYRAIITNYEELYSAFGDKEEN